MYLFLQGKHNDSIFFFLSNYAYPNFVCNIESCFKGNIFPVFSCENVFVFDFIVIFTLHKKDIRAQTGICLIMAGKKTTKTTKKIGIEITLKATLALVSKAIPTLLFRVFKFTRGVEPNSCIFF